jgi:hypothetical protein
LENSAKRYERLFKAYNTPDDGIPSPSRQSGSARTSTKSADRKTSTPKKRKVDELVDDEQSDAVQDDDENLAVIKKDELDESKTVEPLVGGKIKTEPELIIPAEDFDGAEDALIEDKVAVTTLEEEDTKQALTEGLGVPTLDGAGDERGGASSNAVFPFLSTGPTHDGIMVLD